MDLLDIRQKFCEISGRYDLATTSTDSFDTDSGADFFINSGQDFLDRMAPLPKENARVFDEKAMGTWYYDFQRRCRAITEVWVNNSEERFKLEKIDLSDLREFYSGLISATDQGEPAYYSPASLRSLDETDIDSLGSFFNHILADSDDYSGIVIYPPIDEAYVVEVWGKFYSTELTGNTIESYWSINHPMTLVWAALYMLEVSYRNTEGAKDWLGSITANVEGIDMDGVTEEIAELEEMWG